MTAPGTQFTVSPYDRDPEWYDIEVPPGATPGDMIYHLQWTPDLDSIGGRDAKIVDAPVVSGTDPRSRHPDPHNPVDPRFG